MENSELFRSGFVGFVQFYILYMKGALTQQTTIVQHT